MEVNTSVYGVSVEGNASVTITNKLQYKQGTLSTKTVASKNMGGNILEVKMRDTIISILKGKK